MAAKTKSKRQRVSRDDVRDNATKGSGAADFFRLPDGMRIWEPPKAGTYMLDFVPYEVKTENHPDKIDAGKLWYKFPFLVARNIGPANEMLVDPSTVGAASPILEEVARLSKKYDENADIIKEIRPQRWTAYIIVDPDDKTKFAVFPISDGKFWSTDRGNAGLKAELAQGDDEILNFYDVTTDGKTLKVRFADAEFAGRKYLTATRFDFIDRGEMDEDDVLGRVPCLDECFNILPYAKIQKMFLQIDPADAAADKPANGKSATRAGKTGTKPAAAAKPDPDDAGDATFAVGDAVTFTDDKTDEEITGKIITIDDDDVTVETDDGSEFDVDIDELTLADTPDPEPAKPAPAKRGRPPKTPPAATPAEPADTPAAYDEDDWVTFKVGAEKMIGQITDITDEIVTITDTDGTEHTVKMKKIVGPAEPPDTADDPDPADKPAWKKGDMVQDDAGNIGKIIKIDGDDVVIKTAAGEKFDVDIDDLETPADDAADPDDDAADAGDDAPALKPGDAVTWDDGDETGTVVKIHTNGQKIRVKNADGEEWQPIGDVTLVPAKTGKKR